MRKVFRRPAEDLQSAPVMTEDNFHRLQEQLQAEMEKQGKSERPTETALALIAKYGNAYYRDKNGSMRRVFPKR